jgi:uncharacterized protein YukE
MKITMDTDAVRAMASRLRQTADSMDESLTSIKSSVESAGWQSQAREEFLMHLETIRRYSAQSNNLLRLMSQAADQKASQWEAIASVFNGPFRYLGNVWSSIKGFFAGIGSGISNAIQSIKLPSLPEFIGGGAVGVGISMLSPNLVMGGLSLLKPDWKWTKPDWMSKLFEKGKYAGGGAGGSGGGSWGPDNDAGVIDNGAVTNGPTEPGSQTFYDKNNLSDGEYLKTEAMDLYPDPGDLGIWKGHCPKYVKKLVPNINNTSGNSAADWIKDYDLDPFSSAKDLRTQLEPGDVVVWPKGHNNASIEHGHAAVIIEVHEDHVVLAESSWWYENNGKSPRVDRSLSKVDLSDGLYVWSNPEMGQDKIQVGKE